jgi:hypothetical protein
MEEVYFQHTLLKRSLILSAIFRQIGEYTLSELGLQLLLMHKLRTAMRTAMNIRKIVNVKERDWLILHCMPWPANNIQKAAVQK